MTSLSFDQMVTVSKAHIYANTNAAFYGPPGIGKSAAFDLAAHEYANENGLTYVNMTAGRPDKYKDVDNTFGVIDLRLVTMDPVDARGVPTIINGKTCWALPSCLPTVESHGERGVLFLDEINGGSTSVLNAFLQLCGPTRSLGDYTLPDGWCIQAAGNRREDGAHVTRTSTAMNSRFANYVVDQVDVERWCLWGLNNGISDLTVAFHMLRPDLLHDFDPKGKALSFPCPRTVDLADRTITANPSVQNGTEYAIFAAFCGEGYAAEMVAFRKIARTMPSPDGVLSNASAYTVPTDPSVLYALSTALARKATEDNFGRFIEAVSRMPAEFMVLAVKTATDRAPELYQTSAFIRYSIENRELQN